MERAQGCRGGEEQTEPEGGRKMQMVDYFIFMIFVDSEMGSGKSLGDIARVFSLKANPLCFSLFHHIKYVCVCYHKGHLYQTKIQIMRSECVQVITRLL